MIFYDYNIVKEVLVKIKDIKKYGYSQKRTLYNHRRVY